MHKGNSLVQEYLPRRNQIKGFFEGNSQKTGRITSSIYVERNLGLELDPLLIVGLQLGIIQAEVLLDDFFNLLLRC